MADYVWMSWVVKQLSGRKNVYVPADPSFCLDGYSSILFHGNSDLVIIWAPIQYKDVILPV